MGGQVSGPANRGGIESVSARDDTGQWQASRDGWQCRSRLAAAAS